MKNNTVRIRRNGGKPRRLKQAQIKHCKGHAAPPQRPEPGIKEGLYSGNEPVRLLLYDARKDGFFAGADVPPEKLKALRNKALALGLSFGELLEVGLNFLSSSPRPASAAAPAVSVQQVRDCAESVNAAMVQSNVFSELLCGHLDYRENRSGIVLTHEQTQQFIYGVDLIGARLREELANASKAMMNAAYKTKEVSA